MNDNHFRFSKWLLMVGLVALSFQSALADNSPMVSGSYQVVQSRNLGSQSRIELHILLVNHGSSDLSVQRMTLWDTSHADKGGSRACSVRLHAHASAETTQHFTIRRNDYQSWQKGFRPRLVLQIAGPGRAESRTVVRLDRTSGGEAK